MQRRFFWPGMSTDVGHKISNCRRCVCRKTRTNIRAPLVSVKTTQPLEMLCIDFLSLETSKGGYENILVMTDHFSKFAQAFPTRNQLATTVAKVLFDNFVVHYGVPLRLHSDQGRNFESKVIKELCHLLGMTKSRTTPYHPPGNGEVERFNQTLLNMLGTMTGEEKSRWKDHVATMVWAYNCTKHESTGFSPHYLMFGREPQLPVDGMFGLRGLNPQFQVLSKYSSNLQKRLQAAFKAARIAQDKASARYAQ